RRIPRHESVQIPSPKSRIPCALRVAQLADIALRWNTDRMRRWSTLLVTLCFAVSLSGCAPKIAPIARLAAAPCTTAAGALTWYGPQLVGDRSRLSRGCESVSRPAIVAARGRDANDAARDRVSIVTWNM